MKCKSCSKDFTCPEHEEAHLKRIAEDAMNAIYCEACVKKYHTALEAVVHMCEIERLASMGVITISVGGE